MNGIKKRISFNSPVVLSFAALCFAVLILGFITAGNSTLWFFTTYRSSLLSPLTYIRLFTHVLGHADWEHFSGNMIYILLLGPMLEEKYGSRQLLKVMLVTAFVTGLLHFILFPASALCGASGVCFAFILLSSFTGFEKGEIPLTFILAAVVFIGQQIALGIFVADNISNSAHIVGGIVGAIFGFKLAGHSRRFSGKGGLFRR